MSDKNQLTLNHDASCYSEQLTANLVGKCRTENVDGVKYLVAKIAALNPGVLNGSRGPLLYTPEDTRRATKSWNNVPLVVYHPTDNNGHPISAKTDGVVHVGFTKNANYNGKLSVEGWFDIEKTKTTDSRVYDALVNGTPMEVSTGLGTTNEEAPAGASYLGQLYSHIARNHKPDHLAILPDQRGACSLNDGCGLHVNQVGETADDSLCTNCDASGECSECKAKRLKKAPVENEEEMVENEEEEVAEEETAVENCGGVGGTPGPCKTTMDHEIDHIGKLGTAGLRDYFQKTEGKPISDTDLAHVKRLGRAGLSDFLMKRRNKKPTTNESSHDDLSQQVTDFFNRTGTYKMIGNREFLKTLNCGGEGGTPGPCPTGQSASRASKAAEKSTDKARKTNDPKDHEAAYRAHGAALTEHLALRDKTTNDKVYEKHDSAVEEHRSMQAHHMAGEAPAKYTGNQSQSSIRSLLSLVGETLNCGGEGGKPGPCPIGGATKFDSRQAVMKALDSGKVTEKHFSDHNTGAEHARDADYGVGARVKIPKHLGGGSGHVVGFDRDGSYAKVKTGKDVKSFHNSDLQVHNRLQDNFSNLLKRVGTEFTNDKAGKSPATLVANLSDLTRGEPDMAGKLTDADRLKLVEGLTTNSGFEVADIYNEEDTEVLNAMSDEKLFKAALAKQTLIDQQTVVNQVSQITGERKVENMASAIQNAFKPFKKKTKPDDEDMEDGGDDEEAEGETMNSDIRVPRQMTEAEFMKMAPPSIRADLEFSRATQNKEKQELIGSITANVSGDDLDQAVNYLRTKPLPELRIIANMASKPAAPEFDVNIRRSVNYGGMAVPTGNRPTTNKRPGEGPKPVVINWAELSKNNAG